MRTFTAVVNLAADGQSGSNAAAAAKLIPVARLLREAGAAVTVEYSRGLGHAIELAAAAAERGDVILAVGGDGMVGALAGAVVRAGGVLGVVSAGRSNDFARQLGLPADPEALATLLREAEPRATDVIEAAGTIVVGSVYAGIDSVANVYLNRARMLGGAAYCYAVLRALLTWRPASYQVTVDGRPLEERGYAVVVGSSGFCGNERRVAPGARIDDGLLDIVILRHAPGRVVVAVALKGICPGTQVRRPRVEVMRGREVHIGADRELPFGGDGELIGTVPVTVRVLRGALQVLTA